MPLQARFLLLLFLTWKQNISRMLFWSKVEQFQILKLHRCKIMNIYETIFSFIFVLFLWVKFSAQLQNKNQSWKWHMQWLCLKYFLCTSSFKSSSQNITEKMQINTERWNSLIFFVISIYVIIGLLKKKSEFIQIHVLLLIFTFDASPVLLKQG